MDNQKGPLKLIWFSFVLFPFALLFILSSNAETFTSDEVQSVFAMKMNVLHFVMLIEVILAFTVPTLLLKKAKQKLGNLKNLTEEKFKEVYLTPFIIRLVFIEAIALLGFVNANQQQSVDAFYPVFIFVTVFFLFSFPTKEKVEEIRL